MCDISSSILARYLLTVVLASFGWTTLAFAAPTITTQPTPQTVNVGASVSFSVNASGLAPLSYQWRKYTGGSGSANIPGATSPTYTITNAQTTDAAGYYCQVSDSSGAAWSNTVQLTVNGVAPSIGIQPSPQTVNAGAAATFSVTAGGSAPFSYQWRKYTGGNGSANIPGATSSTYTITNAQPSDTAGYHCEVSNSYGVTWSNTVQLTVNGVAPTIASQTSHQTVSAGANATFSVTAAGTAPFSYQWRKNTGGNASTNIPGATSASLTITNAQPTDAAGYYCQVTNSFGVTWSGTVQLTVNGGGSAPAITQQPQGQNVAAGNSASFSVTATGSATLTYQWRKDGANVSGATSSTYTISNVQNSHAGAYSCVVSNSSGSATSSAAQLTGRSCGRLSFLRTAA